MPPAHISPNRSKARRIIQFNERKIGYYVSRFIL